MIGKCTLNTALIVGLGSIGKKAPEVTTRTAA